VKYDSLVISPKSVIPACLRVAASAKAGESRSPDVVPEKAGNHLNPLVSCFRLPTAGRQE